MNVACQFTAWKQLKKRSAPLGYGIKRFDVLLTAQDRDRMPH